MELLSDLFELGVKLLVAWLAALWLQAQTGSPSLFGPFVVCLLAVWFGRELIRRPKGGRKH